MGQVEEGHQGNPNTTDLTGGTSSSRPVLEGSAAQPPGNTNPKPTCTDDAGCPLPGQCSPTSGPSASLRAPLPSSAFCLGHSSCLHLPSPLTLQLRETTRPCLWALPGRQPGDTPGGQWKLSWMHLPCLPSHRAELPVPPLDQHGNHPFPGLVQVPSVLQLWELWCQSHRLGHRPMFV